MCCPVLFCIPIAVCLIGLGDCSLLIVKLHIVKNFLTDLTKLGLRNLLFYFASKPTGFRTFQSFIDANEDL